MVGARREHDAAGAASRRSARSQDAFQDEHGAGRYPSRSTRGRQEVTYQEPDDLDDALTEDGYNQDADRTPGTGLRSTRQTRTSSRRGADADAGTGRQAAHEMEDDGEDDFQTQPESSGRRPATRRGATPAGKPTSRRDRNGGQGGHQEDADIERRNGAEDGEEEEGVEEEGPSSGRRHMSHDGDDDDDDNDEQPVALKRTARAGARAQPRNDTPDLGRGNHSGDDDDDDGDDEEGFEQDDDEQQQRPHQQQELLDEQAGGSRYPLRRRAQVELPSRGGGGGRNRERELQRERERQQRQKEMDRISREQRYLSRQSRGGGGGGGGGHYTAGGGGGGGGGSGGRATRSSARHALKNGDEEDSDDEDELGGGGGYRLRDRSKVLVRPSFNQTQWFDEAEEQARKKQRQEQAHRDSRASLRARSGGVWGGGRDRDRGGGWSDEELLDADPVGGWRGLQGGAGGGMMAGASGAAPAAPSAPWGAPGAFGGLGIPPTPLGALGIMGAGAIAPPGSAAGGHRQPWDVAGGPPAGAHPEAAKYSVKDRGGANAEITPLQVDPSMTFDQVGGLDHYIGALKEMIFLPLIYPELFERFHIAPPRGVLFYGPPGTGKTLVARVLAAQASKAGKKVSFFMRKGADVLSKWVGEAERQLRLLFEEAQRQQPSIIFFDEIDGLAPVRSSKQDQIHNSIVSTLLALMDGLDSRGKLVIIGATNRIDALDPALRRPGRFDRELAFPLPNLSSRLSILDIHTRKWAEPPGEEQKQELASLCVGYCGADLKALCTEAALHAVRRSYPQIYGSEDKLLIQPAAVRVERQDFLAALGRITPAAHRAAVTHAKPLPPSVAPALGPKAAQLLAHLARVFPPAAACIAAAQQEEQELRTAAAASGSGDGGGGSNGSASAVSRFAAGAQRFGGSSSASSAQQQLLSISQSSWAQRARLLVCGPEGAGQVHLGPALLYALEGLPIHTVGLPALLSDTGARSLEEALVHAFVEARRAAPAVLYLPQLHLWWATAPQLLRATLLALLSDLPPGLPLLLLATADAEPDDLDSDVLQLFELEDVVELGAVDADSRRGMLKPLFDAAARPSHEEEEDEEEQRRRRRQQEGGAAAPQLAELPRDPAAVKARAEAEKAARLAALRVTYEDDQAALRALRMALRSLTIRLLSQRRWKVYAEPISPEDDLEYWEVVSQPMDLATILARVDGRAYATPAAYLADVSLILQAAKEYYGTDVTSAKHVSRAAALVDEATSLVSQMVPLELAQKCEAICAKGGPAPPPPGFVSADAEAERAVAAAKEAAREAAEAAARSTRASKRLRGQELPQQLLFGDPEAVQRRIREVKRSIAAAEGDEGQDGGSGGGGGGGLEAAGAEDEEQQQQQQQQGEEEEEEVEAVERGFARPDDVEVAAAVGAAAAADTGGGASTSAAAEAEAAPALPLPAADPVQVKPAPQAEPHVQAAADWALAAAVDATEGWLVGHIEGLCAKLGRLLADHGKGRDRLGVVAAAERAVADACTQHARRLAARGQ